MKIIKANAILLPHVGTPYSFIERVGRTCYKSTSDMNEVTANKFVSDLVGREHWAMLEHETIYLQMNQKFMEELFFDFAREQYIPKYFNFTNDGWNCIMSGSFRAFHDLFIFACDNFKVMESVKDSPLGEMIRVFGNRFSTVFYDDMRYFYASILQEEHSYDGANFNFLSREELINLLKKDFPVELMKHLTHTILFVCDRGVSHEIVRHRPCAFAQESTRYCNYSKDKFGNEITVIDPVPVLFGPNSARYNIWERNCMQGERNYFALIEEGAVAQEARSVLPSSLKTEVIVTCTEEEWNHIINLRYRGTTGAPHPQMKEVMNIAYPILDKESEGRLR